MPRNSNTKLFSLPANIQPADGTNADAADVNNQIDAIVSGELNTARPIEMGGTGATSAAGARQNLGVRPGVEVQGLSTKLTAIDALAWADNRIFAGSGPATIKTLNFRDEDDMSGNDASGVPSQQSVKAYVDGKVAGIPNASASAGLAKSSDDIAFSNGQGTIKNNRVGYDELNAGTGTAGQALVRTSGGIGFATIKPSGRAAAPVNAAADDAVDRTCPPGSRKSCWMGDFSRSASGGSQIRSLAVQLGPDGDGDGFAAHYGRQELADRSPSRSGAGSTCSAASGETRWLAARGSDSRTWSGGGIGVGGSGGKRRRASAAPAPGGPSTGICRACGSRGGAGTGRTGRRTATGAAPSSGQAHLLYMVGA